jgi:tetratricopeptide (TPR) repeat protein
VGDAYGVNVVLSNLGIVAIRRGDVDQAAALAQECLAGCQVLGDEPGIGAALVTLAEAELLQGDLAAAVHFEEARQLLQDLGDDRAASEAYYGLGAVALAQGEDRRAASLFGTSLALAYGVADQIKVADALEGVAGVAVGRGQAKQAAQLLGAAAALRARIEAPVAAHRRAGLDRIVAAARAGLDATAFAAAWATGQAWSLEQAVNEGVGVADVLANSPT